MKPQVILLRDFRGKYLLNNGSGRWFVKRYYRYRPHATEFIQKHKHLKPVVRLAFKPLVGISYILLKVTWAVKILAGVMFVLLVSACHRHKHHLLIRGNRFTA